MKAKELQAQFNVQKQKSVRQHRRGRRRGLLIGFAAAAAVTVGSVVTVGALNNWDYPAVFDRYFSEKSGSPVQYDYTGMGLTIGHVISTDDYTLTVQSVMADTGSVYVAYDIELSDAVKAQVEPYGDALICGGLSGDITDRSGTECYSSTVHGLDAVRSEDGVYHLMMVLDTDKETMLSDKQIQISAEDIYIGYHFVDGIGEKKELKRALDSFTYDLSDITVQPGITVPYGGTLKDDANQNIFDTVTITPFMLRFESEKNVPTLAQKPEWGPVFGEEREKASYPYVAVYADGTEIRLKFRDGHGGSMAMRNDDGSYDTWLVKVVYFDQPIPMDGLVGIRLSWSDQLIAIV